MDSHANVSTGKKSRKSVSRAPIILLLLSLVMATLLALTSCGKSENGTYYRYLDGEIDRSDYIKLDGGKWSENGSGKGTYTVKDGTISFYIPELSETKSVYDGTLTDNGVLTIKSFGEEKYYCRDGNIPKDFTAGEKPSEDNRQEPEEPKVIVTYHANSGVFADGNGETTKQTVEKGSTLTAPTAPTRKNYTFAGWAKQKSGSTLWQFASDKATEDVTLYAVWKQESAVIFSVDGAGMNDDKEIRMIVDHETSFVSLAQKVVCSSDSVWKLYYDKLGQMEIPTKIAAKTSGELSDGDNIFYIVVSTQDGTQSNLYTLNVHRSFEVTLRYSFGDKVTEKKVYTGYECTAMKDPEVRGYTFGGWKDQNGNVIKTTFVPYEDMTLCAVLKAKEYRVTLTDEEGGTSQTTRTVTYDKGYTLPAPVKKGHTFLGWYLDTIQMTDEKGKSLSPWTVTEDKALIAKYKAHQYTVSVSYNDNFVEVIGAGVYEYGSTVKLQAEPFIVGTPLCWYNGSTKLTDEKEYSFKLEKEENISLRVQVDIPQNVSAVFQFSSHKTQITKLLYKDAQNIYIPSFVTSIDRYAFSDCTGLTSMTIPFVGETRNGTYNTHFGYIFGAYSYWDNKNYVPSSLKTVVITGGTSIGVDAFWGCTGLTSITIENGVTSIGSSAFRGCTGLTSITIPDSVTSIGSSAFEGCTGLTSITIPDSVTSIGSYAFEGCTGLTSITLPDSVTSIGSSAFSVCTGLTSITIPNSVTSIGYKAFYECMGLTSITIPDSVTSIGNSAFSGCKGLTSIKIPDSVTSIGDSAFADCTGLTSVTMGNGVTSIGSYAFEGCTGLTSITIPDSVTSIGYSAFYRCAGLTSVTMGNGVTSIGGSAFCDCTGLTSITIGNSVTNIGSAAFYNTAYYNDSLHWENGVLYIGNHLIKVNSPISGGYTIKSGTKCIGDFAFSYCTGLTSVTIPDSVTSIGDDAFKGCARLTNIIVESGNQRYHVAGNCLIETATKTLIWGCKNSVIPSDGSVTSIGNQAFYECMGLTSITIPNSVTSIGYSAFYRCAGLTSVTMGNGVTSIGDSAFSDCTGLTSIAIPNSVTSIGSSAFAYCTRLMSITIPDGVTSIGSSAFEYCYTLIEVVNHSSLNIKVGSSGYGYIGYYAKHIISNAKDSYLTTDENGYTFYEDGSNVYLMRYTGTGTELVLPSASPKGKTYEIYQYAFYQCSKLTSITLPDSVTSIGSSAFSVCTGLTSVSIGNGVTSIGSGAFRDCTGLTSITIPNSVTSIGNSAFSGCKGLTSITIPDSVTSIDSDAFEYCYKLIEVINLSSLNITAGSKDYGYIGSYAKHIIKDAKDSYLTTDENGYIFYDDGSNAYLMGYAGTDIELVLPKVSPKSKTYEIYKYAFYNCSKLASITIPKGVKNIGGGAFAYCIGLTSITIPNSVTSIGSSAFAYCTGLTSITIPNSVTSIGDDAFYCCTGLTSITIPNSVTSIGQEAFYNTAYYNDASHWENGVLYIGNYLIKANNTILGSYTIKSGTKCIGGSAFSGCTGLTSITIPDSVTSIGDDAFYGCTGLTSVTIGNGMTSIGNYAFKGCTGLTSVTIPNGVTSIGKSAFEGCKGLTSITISDSVTSIGNGAFSGTAYYNDASNWENGVLYIGNHLMKAKSSISGVYTIKSGTKCIGNDAFFGCTGLTSVTIPDSVTSIGKNAFQDCRKLIEVVNYSSLKITAGSEDYGYIGYYAKHIITDEKDTHLTTDDNGYIFYDDGSNVYLVGYTGTDTELVLPETSPKGKTYEIYNDAFSNCTNITSITLKNNILAIGNRAFSGCEALKIIRYEGSKEMWDALISGVEMNFSGEVIYNYKQEENK